MSEHNDLSAEELHAFVDDELDESRRAQIAELIAGDAASAARVAQFRADKARLLEVYGEVADLPLPENWLALIEKGTQRRRNFVSWPAMAAIAATIMALVFVPTAYRGELAPRGEDIIAEALAARNDTMAPGRIEAVSGISASENRNLAVALKMRVKAPDLAKLGYRLAALKMYGNVPAGGAAELVYRDGRDGVFTLYMRRSTSAPRFDQYEQGGVRICIWQDDVLGTVMIGKMSAAEMQRLASLAYTGLTS